MSITIKDVAREAEVSISTVSKVINKSPTISQATVDRVNEVMKKLDYYPNQSASNFARQSTRNIVFLTRLERDVAFSNPHMFEIMCGAQKALSEKNYNLSLMSINTDQEEMDLIKKIIAQKSADGIILHGSVINRDLPSLLVNTNFPHLIIGKPEFESQLCWIDTNNHLSGEIAAGHLLECGYKKIAFIGGSENDMISMHRLQGFQCVMEQKNIEYERDFISFGFSTKDSGYAQMNQLLDSLVKPEAVICENNSIALGVVKSINEHGLSIPGDIAVITFDEYPFSHIIEPIPTVVNINVFDMGIQAGSTLIRKIKNPSLQVQSYTTLPELIVRGTTRQ
ncbi:MAG: alanine racemase [Eubacterium sp.]|jgi:DNA-binding LacI/PurR family transcriptional regulator|nr:alanine racemase [Eubacterium sp.]